MPFVGKDLVDKLCAGNEFFHFPARAGAPFHCPTCTGVCFVQPSIHDDTNLVYFCPPCDAGWRIEANGTVTPERVIGACYLSAEGWRFMRRPAAPQTKPSWFR